MTLLQLTIYPFLTASLACGSQLQRFVHDPQLIIHTGDIPQFTHHVHNCMVMADFDPLLSCHHFADLRPVILDPLESRQDSSESASSWSLSALDEAASRVHLSSLDFSSNPRVVRERSGSAGTRRVQMLTHESSIDQESSQLSQDSSNGSISQADELVEESSLSMDASLHFRTTLHSPNTSTPVERGSPAEAPPTAEVGTPTGRGNDSVLSSGSSNRGLGRSVIVGRRTESGVGGEVESSGVVTSSQSSEGEARDQPAEQATTSQGENTRFALTEIPGTQATTIFPGMSPYCLFKICVPSINFK